MGSSTRGTATLENSHSEQLCSESISKFLDVEESGASHPNGPHVARVECGRIHLMTGMIL